ncbi:MAG: hypothetical protein EA408_03655 [Marinilabiliales bacterium]|nr:MAG: hypothetical protein EA408_03655 [Marinilabiliales bacterium]
MKTETILRKYARPYILTLLFAIVLIVNFLLFPLLMPAGQGVKPLDVMFAYSPAEAYEMIASYSEQTRQNYIRGLLLIDFAYPVIYSLLLGFGIYLLWRNPRLSLQPLLIIAADYLENTGILMMLSAWPEWNSGLAIATSIFTTLKWSMVAFAVILILSGLVRRYIIRT